MQTHSTFFPHTFHFLVLTIYFLIGSVLFAAEPTGPDSVQCDVHTNGKKLGRMTFSVSELPGEYGPILSIKRRMDIGARFLLVVKISVDIWEETLRNESGGYSFHRQASGMGHKAVQKGTFDGRKLVFDTEVDGKLNHFEFDDSLFDCTSMDIPEADMVPGEERTLQVLNLENQKLSEQKYRCLRYEDLCVGDDTVACKVIQLGNGNTLEWISRGQHGLLIKQVPGDPKYTSVLPVAVVWKDNAGR